LLPLLYLKPTHALILKHTFTSTFIKTLKLFKKYFVKASLTNPTRFGLYFYDHPQGLSFVLGAAEKW
jgi:hypothetical protein